LSPLKDSWALYYINEIIPDHFHVIESRVLAYRLLVTRRRMRDAWLTLGCAIRSAFALGLHRDPSKTRLNLSRIASVAIPASYKKV
jgi:hypothetical protein